MPKLKGKKREINPVEFHHRPKSTSRVGYVAPLKESSRECLKRLASYSPRRSPPYPKSRSAAVLVALFVGRWGDLYVLLSRRAANLSTYAGDTALPGGKVDKKDTNLEYTARREALEEIGLPIDKRNVPLLCLLEPFLARNHLIVTPVVVLITDPTLRPILNAPEVDTLFSHPLESFLHETAPFPLPSSSPFFPDTTIEDQSTSTTATATLNGPPPPKPDPTHYHSWHDMDWGPTPVRIHSFLTGRESSGMKPIAGLTASILLEVARIGYDAEAEVEVDAPGQATRRERISWEMNRDERFQAALKREHIKWDWDREEWLERKSRIARGRIAKSRL